MKFVIIMAFHGRYSTYVTWRNMLNTHPTPDKYQSYTVQNVETSTAHNLAYPHEGTHGE